MVERPLATQWIPQALLENAELANLVVAVLILLVGAVYYLSAAEPLQSFAFTKRALEFWLLHWAVLVVLYALLTKTPLPPTPEMLFVDAQSLFLIAFAFCFLRGAEYRPKTLWLLLGGAALLLVVWHLVLGHMLADSLPGSIGRLVWIGFSFLLAFFALFIFGHAFFVRYGLSAIPVTMLAGIYALLQWPVFTSVIVKQTPASAWFVLLALAKVPLGFAFYLYYFSPLETYEPSRRKQLTATEIISFRSRASRSIWSGLPLILAIASLWFAL